jgi:hypothetical protein
MDDDRLPPSEWDNRIQTSNWAQHVHGNIQELSPESRSGGLEPKSSQ